MGRILLPKYVLTDIAKMDKVRHVLLEPLSTEMVGTNLITVPCVRLDLPVLTVLIP